MSRHAGMSAKSEGVQMSRIEEGGVSSSGWGRRILTSLMNKFGYAYPMDKLPSR